MSRDGHNVNNDSQNPDWQIDKQQVRRNFDRAATTYDAAAVLQQEVATRTLERFDFIKFEPASILDIGCGTGQLTLGLMQRFRQANITALDLSPRMLDTLKSKISLWQRWRRKPEFVCADAEQLPLEDNQYDLVVSGLTLQWCNKPDQVFSEVLRVLRPGGLFMFTTFGPDTLKELRECWSSIDNYTHVSAFLDMHDIGDALMRHKFAEPVMDTERLCLTYSDVKQLLRELKQIGANNATEGRNKNLTRREQFASLAKAYEQYRENGVLPASYEIVYGHAWKADPENSSRSVAVEFKL